MNRKQILMIIVAVMLFTGAGSVLAISLKSKPSLDSQQSSENNSNTGSTNKQTNSGTNNQSSTETPSTKSKGNSTQQQTTSPSSNTNTNSTTSPTSTNPYTPPVTETCPDYLRQSYSDSYNANINAENINYQNNKDSIRSYWNSRGLLNSGAAEAALAAEDQRHQSALTSIENNYQQQLSNSNCS